MITEKEVLKTLQAYNINSQSYGPTIYKNKDELGLCIDIKDTYFGYLTRAFTFKNITDLETFLKKYFWVKNNIKKYNLETTLDEYESKTPNIIYKYNDKILELDDMLNLDEIIKETKEQDINEQIKEVYIKNIDGLINYLNSLYTSISNNKIEKNNLKTKENDLKFELIELLAKYYGNNKRINKREISTETVQNNIEPSINYDKLSIIDCERILNNLINKIKNVELNDKNIITSYSNEIYKYNIEILNKQIEFVKNKIEAQKNFDIKGSKLHNIDEELKSFLKKENTPKKIETYIEEKQNEINNKYNNIVDIKKSYEIISGNTITLPIIKDTIIITKEDALTNLKESFNNLNEESASLLTLYNSMYKNICNYIINNNYPSKEEIKNNNDFDYLYNYIDEIIHNENNTFYLNKYFKYLNFKNLDLYIESIINICHKLENTKYILEKPIKAFYIEDSNLYKSLTLEPIYTKEKTYIIDINNTNIIYIPDKIEIDEDTNELNTSTTKNIYIKGDIIESVDNITLVKYSKIQEKKKDITITTNLKKAKEITFNIATIMGDKNE